MPFFPERDRPLCSLTQCWRTRGRPFVREPVNNEPSGLLTGGRVLKLVRKVLPQQSRAENTDALRFGLKMLNSFGVTNIIEAKSDKSHLDAFLDLANRGQLTCHVRLALYADITKGEQAVADVIALKKEIEANGRFTPDIAVNQVKIFIDGTVEDENAAMQWNYTNKDSKGRPRADSETLNRIVAAFDAVGMQIHVHAIGDLGIKMVLDAFEHAREVNGIRDSRHHIAHLHVVDPNDIDRFHELGVTANFQSLWASGDDDWVTKVYPKLIADERLNWQYPIGAIVRSGATVVFGSDWGVTTANPLPAMQVAITRRGPDNIVQNPWIPEQLVDLPAVVDGYTRKGAWISFREEETGTLEKGKLADMVILNKDLFLGKKTELINNEVKMTVFRGRVVYKKD